MPSKGRQRASRQTQIKSKRRKGRSRVVDSRTDGSKESAASTNTRPSSFSANSQSKLSPTEINESPSPRSSQVTASAATPLEYPYLPGEIRQVGIVASIVLLLLIAFTFIPLG